MKVAVSSTGPTLESQVDPRFGRCPYFIIVDTESMRYEAVENTSMASPSGAGIGAARLIASHGVEAVITGNVGPNALQALSAAGIRIYTGAMGTVRDAIEAFKSGGLREGVGPGMPFGAGMGMG
ncbi:NifB/NifX family molybdenum-iron cluster-binding protein, partial [Candidatus Bathyarchaeota archaeon]|nr:NifB/NifX family molybdenum-iron cluster-binding protein [Candidatus Bathyarchaeota archaeon]